jgi:hypothetical protein
MFGMLEVRARMTVIGAFDRRGDAMRVNKWGVGVILAASILLTGCTGGGADKAADPKPSEAAQEESAAPESNCPELTEGATIDGATLGECLTDAMADSAGFAAKVTTLGMESTTRYDPADKAIETISPMGSMVIIGDDVWVKSSTSEWQAADAASSDPVIAGLSTAADSIDPADPTGLAGALSGEFTVTGTGTRLGQDVFVLTGTAENQGVQVETTFEVTADYINLLSKGSAQLEGQAIDTTMEITEWDVAQDIVAPM